MTYPQPPYPPQGQPGYPPQGQPGYAPQQPYPPQMQPQPAYGPPQPGYAPLPAYPAVPGAPAPQVGYYPQPQQPMAPPMPAVRATLGEFMDQPTFGGGSATSKFFTKQRPVNSWLQMQVTRDLMASDVQQQTDNANQPQFLKTGGQPDYTKPKLVLIVPTQVLGSSDPASAQAVFPDGACAIWVKGVTRDSLLQAMSQAGIPQPDKVIAAGKIGGAVITMISAGTRPARTAQYSDTNLFNFQYQPGGHELEAFEEVPTVPGPVTGAAPAPAAAIPATPPAAAAPPAPPAQSPTGYPMDPNGMITYAQQLSPTAPPAPAPIPAAPAAAYPPPAPGAPQGYNPYPALEAPQPQQYAPPAPPQNVNPPYDQQAQQYQQQSPGFAPQAPGQPPAPPGAPPMSAEMAATLARLSGQG
jgi:hypothetical protein